MIESSSDKAMLKSKIKKILIDILIGQFIVIGYSSGGIFTNNLVEKFQLFIPIMLDFFVYAPLNIYFIVYKWKARKEKEAVEFDDEGCG